MGQVRRLAKSRALRGYLKKWRGHHRCKRRLGNDSANLDKLTGKLLNCFLESKKVLVCDAANSG